MRVIKRPLNIALFVAVLCLVALRCFSGNTEVSPDSPRYVAMGLNLAQHGVLTGSRYSPDVRPEPGLGMGGVFTAYEIALAALLDGGTKDDLTCLVTKPSSQNCELNVPALKTLYVFEVFIFHISVFFISRIVFRNDYKAWVAVAFSMMFEETRQYVESILSEPAYMMALGLFSLSWIAAWQNPEKLRLWLLCGIALGLVILVKPAWAALVPVLGLLFILGLAILRHMSRVFVCPAISLVIGVVIMTLPLLVRNVVQFDLWGLSDPSYMVASMAHRFAFNAMSWAEWAMGWIFYLPDFGDKAAHALFGVQSVERLDWGPASYYAYGSQVLHGLAMKAGSTEQARDFLLANHFFDDPVKSFAVTALLAWRGFFTGDLAGFSAAILMIPFFWLSGKEIRRDVIIIFIPLICMVGVHALVSVSIQRYNIGLIVPFALVMAHVVYSIGRWGLKRGLKLRRAWK